MIIVTCPKCHTTFKFLGEKPPEGGRLCPECKSRGYTMVGIIHFEPEKPTLKESAKALLKYIEDSNITDEACNDGDGRFDEWRSSEFETLINEVKEALKP